MWLDDALKSMKGDLSDKESLLTVLKAVKLPNAPRGPIKLDAYSNPIQNIYIRKVEMVDGHLKNKVIATVPEVSQFWHWSPTEYLKQPLYKFDVPACKFCIDKK